VRRLLAALPERYGKILELRFLQAASIREAAAHLGVTVGNAKVLQYRALRAAAKFIDAEGR
jgi:DNA-directed RNA polymerase specialized sigma24 family protein